MENRSLVIVPSSVLLAGALTLCSVDLSSSFDQRIMKSPILKMTAPWKGGAATNLPEVCYVSIPFSEIAWINADTRGWIG